MQDPINKFAEEFEENLEELTETAEKMLKGYSLLSEIDEIDVATTPKELIWKQDKVKLFRYTPTAKQVVKTPLLVTYALVNRQDMLDLQPDRSTIRNLLELGIDIYIIDWGYPTYVDRYNTMEDYILGYLDDMVDFVLKKTRRKKLNLMGICQGGTFSTIYSTLFPNKIKNLITLVTPIDFSTEDGLLFKWSRDMDVDTIVEAYDGIVPGEFLNFGFDLLKPMSKLRKWTGLVNMFEDENKLKNFLRMEKWINDSPDQAGECYRQFIKNFYQQNKLVKGEFELGGQKVDLKSLKVPLLNIYATEDHLVPPSSTIPLNDLVGTNDKELLAIPGGHIGVFVGGRAQKLLAPTIQEWLLKRDK